jgi:urate oxidase
VHDAYGKAAIRLVKVVREGARHRIHDCTVEVRLEGRFETAHTEGINAEVLPTDTMKNTVFALAKDAALEEPERFAHLLGRHFLDTSAAADRVTIELMLHRWDRISPHAFTRGTQERRLAVVTATRDGVEIEAGLAGLGLLKTAGSGFEGFPRDRYTTLRETADRIFATDVSARWRYAGFPSSCDDAFDLVRAALVDAFAGHESKSVQHTLYAMGEAALAACPELVEIDLTMPNRHHLLVDLEPFGLDNRGEVFHVDDRPYGLIEATVLAEQAVADDGAW